MLKALLKGWDGRRFLARACPIWGTWFVEFMRVTKLRMGLIKKQ